MTECYFDTLEDNNHDAPKKHLTGLLFRSKRTAAPLKTVSLEPLDREVELTPSELESD